VLGLAVAVSAIGLVLKLIAAQSAGWFLVPLAAAAGICHVWVHATALRTESPPLRLAALSDVLLIGAVLMQIDYNPGYNCAEDTLSSVFWRLGMASEEGCILMTGVPAIIFDIAIYVPVAATWLRLRKAAAEAPSG
jgi:hypothetical protein